MSTGTLTGSALGQTASVVLTLLPASVDTYSFNTSSLVGSAGGTVTFDVLANTSRLQPAAQEFSIYAPSASISAFNVVAGPAVSSASKSLSFATSTSVGTATTEVIVVIAGVNQTTIANGTIAIVTATLASAAVAGTIALSSPSSANVSGNAITAAISTSGGTIALAVNPTLSITVATDPNTVSPNPDSIEPGEVLIGTVSLSGTSTSSTVVSLVSSNPTDPGFTVPASVTIPAGTLTATFSITGV